MSVEIVAGLIANIVLLMSLSVIYPLFSNDTKLSRSASKLIMGLSIALVGFVVMATAVEVEPGIFFDGRSILMLISSMFFGLVPAVIGAIFLSFYRVIMGGPGVIPGILWVVIPGIIGVVWRYFRIKKYNIDLSKISILEQYLLLFITQTLMVVILFLFPNRVSNEVINAVALPLSVFYPIGGLAVTMFMLRQRKQYFQSIEISEREKEYTNLFNKSASYSFLVNPSDGRIINVNQAAIDHYGYTFKEFTSMTIFDLNMMTYEEVEELQRVAKKENRNYYNSRNVLKDKTIIDIEVRTVPIVIHGVTYNYATVTDITDRIYQKQVYQDVNIKLEATLHSVSEGIISTNKEGTIEVINDIAKRYLSVSDDVIGEKITNIVQIYSKEQNDNFDDIFNDVINKNISFKTDTPYNLINNKKNITTYVDFSLSSIYYDDEVRGAILVFRDVTNQFEQNKQIQYISQHDYLTGLYNRYFLETEMKRLDTKRQLPISIIHGDINGLKLTNDAFGHIEGDNLLKEIGDILKKSARSEDIIARWGGDEFIILLPQTSNENAKLVIKRIRDLQNKSTYDIMKPSISLGLATKTIEKEDLNAIFIDAETEMYNNKQTDGKIMRKNFLQTIQNKMKNIHPDLIVHTKHVSDMCEEFGTFLGLEEEDIDSLKNAGKYHDIGMINVPDKLMLKTDSLSNHEQEIIQSHCDVGFRIMKAIPELSQISDIILNHHEQFNGEGYPSNIKGKNIPYLSRIVSIIDAYDMMVNNSIYTPIMTTKEAIIDLRSKKGTQFDPKLVEKFIEMITHLE